MRNFFLLLFLSGDSCFSNASRQKNHPIICILHNAKIWTRGNLKAFVEATPFVTVDHCYWEILNQLWICRIRNTSFGILDGKLVTAGFQTMHIFTFWRVSMGLTQVELSGAETFWCCHCKYLKLSLTIREKEWITGRGWQYTFWIRLAWPSHNTWRIWISIDGFIRCLRWVIRPMPIKGAELAELTKATSVQWDLENLVKRRNEKNQRAWRRCGVARWWSCSPMIAFWGSFEMDSEKLKSMRASSGITSFQNCLWIRNDLRLVPKKLYDNGNLFSLRVGLRSAFLFRKWSPESQNRAD